MPVAEEVIPVRPGAVPYELRRRLDALRERIRFDARLQDPTPEPVPEPSRQRSGVDEGELPEHVRRRLETATAVLVELRNRNGERAIRWVEGLSGVGRELRATAIEGPDRVLVRAAPATDMRADEHVEERVFDFVSLVGLIGAPLFRERGLGPPNAAEHGYAEQPAPRIVPKAKARSRRPKETERTPSLPLPGGP